MALTAFVGRVDGSAWLRDALTRAGPGVAPRALGASVAERLLSAGARRVSAGECRCGNRVPRRGGAGDPAC